MDWVEIPRGWFQMGSDEPDAEGEPTSAAPAHTVEVGAFAICRTPVSVAEFAAFVEATGYVTTAERIGTSWLWKGDPAVRVTGQDHLWFQVPEVRWNQPRGPGSDVADKQDHPVTHVSLADCQAFCDWAGCRLPSEAEWERAVRGTDGRRFTWGDTPPDPSLCNYSMHVEDTTPIGAYPDTPSPHGLLDGAGNVWEWTTTRFHRYPYLQNPPRRIETRAGVIELGVIRGGSFFNDYSDDGLFTYTRVYSLLDYTCYDLGFRVCAA